MHTDLVSGRKTEPGLVGATVVQFDFGHFDVVVEFDDIPLFQLSHRRTETQLHTGQQHAVLISNYLWAKCHQK